MAAMLNGAACLEWICAVLGETDIGAMVARVAARPARPSPVLFLPYLAGERTPHDDPAARGVFAGLEHATAREDLVRAVMEGVAFSLADGVAAFAGNFPEGPLPVIGGGARNAFWLTLIACALDRPVQRFSRAENGPAFGAARLARAALGESPEAVFRKPPVAEVIAPDPELVAAYRDRIEEYRALYAALRAAR